MKKKKEEKNVVNFKINKTDKKDEIKKQNEKDTVKANTKKLSIEKKVKEEEEEFE